MRYMALLFVLMLSISVAAVAQGMAVDLSTPEAVVRGYSEAMKAHHVADMVKFIHPAMLDTFKVQLMAVLEDAARSKNKEAHKVFASFGGGKSIKELRAMNSAAFAVNFVESLINGDKPGVLDQTEYLDGTPIGHVMEGDDLAHVVIRTNIGGDPGIHNHLLDMLVITVRRNGDHWGIASPTELESVVEAVVGWYHASDDGTNKGDW